MSLTTVYKLQCRRNDVKSMPSNFHSAVNAYLTAMDKNDADAMRSSLATIKKIYPTIKAEYSVSWSGTADSTLTAQFQNCYLFVSNVNYYQSVNGVGIDKNTGSIYLAAVSTIRNDGAEGVTEKDMTQEEIDNKVSIVLRILIARRLDEPDLCNITDPDTVISPCGCHYSKNDINYLVQNKYCNDEYSARDVLAKNDKYIALSSDVKKIISEKGIKFDLDSLLAYFKMSKDDIIANIKKGANPTSIGWQQPSQTQIESAKRQGAATPSPVESVDMKTTIPPMTDAQKNTVFAESDFARWLLENINVNFRADPKSPMIPTSIGASIALVRGTNSTSGFGQYNFWKLLYDKKLTSLPQNSEYCDFETATDGIKALLVLLHSESYQNAVSSLKEKMWDSTDEDKDKATKAIIEVLDPTKSIEQTEQALKFVEKYKMREWDTDKKESEGGHADTQPGSSQESKRVDDTLSKAVNKVIQALGTKGVGVLVVPVGTDYSKITKLPRGKTPCEPVYPDYVTVGDTVPDWIMSETYAKIAKEAEEQALKAVGIMTQTEDEIELENINNKISSFQDQQFVAWCKANGVSYSNDTEKAAAQQKYTEAASKDPSNFTNGVYTPDNTTKSAYQSLLKDKANIVANGDIFTAAAHLNYVNGIETAKAEIYAREGNWNQDTGHPLSAEELGYAGGTDFSAVQSSDATALTGGVTVTDTFKVTAYTADGSAIEGPPMTATGESLEGKTVDAHIIAVDKTIIPLHTVVNMQFIDSKWQKYNGDYRALDVGGGIIGKHIDLFIGHNRNDLAEEFGVQQATVRWTKPGTIVQGGSTGNSTGDIEAAVKFAESKAGGQYSMENRDGPSYDCSSLVYWALDAGGFPIIAAWRKNPRYSAQGEVKGAGATATGGYNSQQKVGDVDTIWTDIQTMGASNWTKMSWSSAKGSLKRGDIVAYWSSDGSNGHCYFVKSNSQTIEARGTAYGIGSWPLAERTPTYDIQEVYRYNTPTPVTTATSNDTSGVGAILANTQTAKRTSQIMVVMCTGGASCNFSFWQNNSGTWTKAFSCSGVGGSNGFSEYRTVGSRIAPCGSFPITYAFGHMANPGTSLTYYQTNRGSTIGNGDQWGGSGGEAVGSAQYDGCYDYAMVIGFNDSRKIGSSGTGGCIFLHCPSSPNGTAGCIAIPTNDVIKALQLAKPGCYIIIAKSISDIKKY